MIGNFLLVDKLVWVMNLYENIFVAALLNFGELEPKVFFCVVTDNSKIRVCGKMEKIVLLGYNLAKLLK